MCQVRVGYSSAALFHHMGQSLLPEHVDIVATEKVALAVEVNAELRLLQGTGMLRRVGGRLRTGHTPRPR